ncbi:hypothetical protein G5I_06868 [Acromyrmex echinatior]|uniref:Uncharacterized protein n=1 Tax=Acromyrmex echinatior TaxID=103372 RepID=F4WM35_ACREC|nr:hypothetical protein G5I_06868 [Acromyrmex echinatior]
MSERTSGGYNLPYTRAHYRNSPDRLGSGATIRCPTEKPASHGTGFRCTRVFVRLTVEPVAYRAHRFHCGLSHVKRAAAEQVSPREKEGEKCWHVASGTLRPLCCFSAKKRRADYLAKWIVKPERGWINFRNAAGSTPTEGSADRKSIGVYRTGGFGDHDLI